MDQRALQDIVSRLNALERGTPRLRIGVVTDISPLSVALGGSDTSYAGVSSVNGARPAVGDRVMALLAAGDLIVLGTIGVGGGPDWQTPTFASGWGAYRGSAVEYAVSPSGLVHLRGLLTKATADITNGETAFTLPVGARPGAPVRVVSMWNDTSMANIGPQPDGGVAVFSASLSGSRNGFFPLDGVSFWAEG